jgi:hypothetical protein
MPKVMTCGSGTVLSSSDVCKVKSPAGDVPTCFPNSARTNLGAGCPEDITICGAPIHTVRTRMLPSQGDQAGTDGGMVSGTTGAEAGYARGIKDITFAGDDAVNLCCPTRHNKGNAAGNPARAPESPFDIARGA